MDKFQTKTQRVVSKKKICIHERPKTRMMTTPHQPPTQPVSTGIFKRRGGSGVCILAKIKQSKVKNGKEQKTQETHAFFCKHSD